MTKVGSDGRVAPANWPAPLFFLWFYLFRPAAPLRGHGPHNRASKLSADTLLCKDRAPCGARSLHTSARAREGMVMMAPPAWLVLPLLCKGSMSQTGGSRREGGRQAGRQAGREGGMEGGREGFFVCGRFGYHTVFFTPRGHQSTQYRDESFSENRGTNVYTPPVLLWKFCCFPAAAFFRRHMSLQQESPLPP